MSDGRIEFNYLDNLIREDVFTTSDDDNHRYKSKTIRFPCVVESLNAELTLIISPKSTENGVTRDVYVEIQIAIYR